MATNVKESAMIFDVCRIGKEVPVKYPGGFDSFTALATAEEVPFLNVRNSSEAGQAYTNITSKDKLPWPFVMESIGIRFVAQDPNLPEKAAPYLYAMSKMFMHLIPEHAWIEFYIREDMRLWLKPHMAPPGYGHYGEFISFVMTQGTTGGNAGVMGSGFPEARNRFKMGKDGIEIPRETPISAKLKFSEYGKKMLIALGDVPPLATDGGTPPIITLHGEASIEMTLRGYRLVQQRGDYHN